MDKNPSTIASTFANHFHNFIVFLRVRVACRVQFVPSHVVAHPFLLPSRPHPSNSRFFLQFQHRVHKRVYLVVDSFLLSRLGLMDDEEVALSQSKRHDGRVGLSHRNHGWSKYLRPPNSPSLCPRQLFYVDCAMLDFVPCTSACLVRHARLSTPPWVNSGTSTRLSTPIVPSLHPTLSCRRDLFPHIV